MKTLTMEVDNSTYKIIKQIAKKENENISNFLSLAVSKYLESSKYVDNIEEYTLWSDKELTHISKVDLSTPLEDDEDYSKW